MAPAQKESLKTSEIISLSGAANMGSPLVLLLLAALVYTVRCQRKDQNVCRKDNGLFEHEQYCDYYYECEDGVPTLQLCPNGLAFSGKNRGLLNNCDYPHRVGCPDDDGRIMGQTPQSSENCHWQYGVFAHQTSCTRYWQCWNGTATIQQCPFSLLYNDVMHACDWPDNVPDCQKHPICKDNPNGHIPIEKSCVRYWLCVGGYPRLQRCPAGLAFSPTGLRCELADNIPGCEPPPTTAPPEEADERPPQRPRPAPQQQAARPPQAPQAVPQQRRFSPPPQQAPVADQEEDYADAAAPNRAQGVVRRPAFRQAAAAAPAGK